MRIAILFSPAFLVTGKAFVKSLQRLDASLEVVAIASNKFVYEDLRKDESLALFHLDCIEYHEQNWLDNDYIPSKLERIEAIYGSSLVNSFVVADRQVGAGYISGAFPQDTKLYRSCRDSNKVRAYIIGTVEFFEKLAIELDIDSVFLYAIAGAYSHTMGSVFQHHGMHVCRLQHTRIDDRILIDTSLFGKLNPVWERINKGGLGSEQYTEEAKQWLQDYRDKTKAEPDYMDWVRKTIRKNLSPLGIAYNIIHSILRAGGYALIKGKKGLHTLSLSYKIKDSILYPYRYYLAINTQKRYDKEILNSAPYIYVPLHMDPEASTMHLAPNYTDQMAVVEALSKQAPLHYNILVKENPYMLGRRPQSFYKRLSSLPRVYIVNPEISGAEIIKHSKLVFTITGTSAWEACLIGKPSVVLGKHYPFLPLKGNIIKCSGLDQVDEAVNEAICAEKTDDSRIQHFLSIIFEDSVRFDSNLLWGKVDEALITQKQHMIDNLARAVLKSYSRYWSKVSDHYDH
ncbi:MAG: hypothetical protein NZ828_10020 [Alphaproteobacteria bacterium]|jgi:hypothetical protein|nr:hypothetical protein [Alphaproteobacteria bacterium]